MDAQTPSQDAENPLVTQLRIEWALGRGPDALARTCTADILADDPALAEILAADAEERWARGHDATIETYAALVPDLPTRPEACRSLLMCELARRDDRDDPGVGDRLKRRLPELAGEIDLVVGFFQSIGAEVSAAASGKGTGVEPGQTLGTYKLRSLIGRGSFGEVWLAWDAVLERAVALKLLPEPLGGQAETLLAEARTAAGLDHDNIVRVHSAGRFEALGLVYIDAQLISDGAGPGARTGRSLDDWMCGRPVPARRAAALMARVCAAVSAAHARAVVHGDIKPANILLGPDERPMVADFGLAVLSPEGIGAEDPSATVCVLDHGRRITGTPAYMSPEQARGQRPTPLSDIYSLGVTLAALLTGRSPFSPRPGSARAALDVIEQVRESGPDMSAAEAIDRTLGAICRRATAQDPRDRYSSADQMGADLLAWATHHPTTARPRGSLARAALWWRRHALPATITLASALALATLGARHVMIVEAERNRALDARADAADAYAVSEAVNQYLRTVLGAADSRELGVDATVADALDHAVERITADLAGQPRVEAGARATIGATFLSLGRHPEAEEQLTLAYQLHARLYGPGDPKTLAVLHSLASLRQDQGDLDEGERLLRQVVAGRTQALGPHSETTLLARTDLARVFRIKGRLDDAERELTDVIALMQQHLDPDNSAALIARKDLANLYTLSGRPELAIGPMREIHESLRRTLGDDHPDTLVALSDLASALRRGTPEQRDEAIGLFKQAYDGFCVRQPPGHMDRVIVLFNIANALRFAQRWEECLEYARRAIAEGEPSLGPDHYVVLASRALEAGMLGRLGEPDSAREMLLGIRAKFVELFGEDSGYTAMVDALLQAIAEITGADR